MSSTVKSESNNTVNKNDLDRTSKSKTLPLDFFPECWVKDEERMEVRNS